MSEAMPATGIAGILAAPGSCARPSRAVPPGSVAELSCQKIIFDLQLADLPVQMIDLGLIAGSLRRTTTLEDACRTVQQLLLPVVDLVRVDPELPSQLGDGPVAPDGRQRHLRLEHRAVLLPCPLHVLLPRYPRFLGAGLHLSHLSHFRGPAQSPRTRRHIHRILSASLVRAVEQQLIGRNPCDVFKKRLPKVERRKMD